MSENKTLERNRNKKKEEEIRKPSYLTDVHGKSKEGGHNDN